MKFLAKYPRMSFLLIGLAVGFLMVGLNDQWAKDSIAEYRSIASSKEKRYEELLAKSYTEIDSLSSINESLKQRVKKKTVTRPDGTITEEIDTATDSTTSTDIEIRETIRTEYEKKLSVEIQKTKEEQSKITNPKLNVSAGIDTNRSYFMFLSYSAFTPFGIGIGATSDGKFMIGGGISL